MFIPCTQYVCLSVFKRISWHCPLLLRYIEGVAEHFGIAMADARNLLHRDSAAAPWTGAIVFSNIDLPCLALRNIRWPQRRSRLLTLVMHWFEATLDSDGSELHGIFFSNIGGIDDMLGHDEKDKFGEMIREAFLRRAECEPQLLWNDISSNHGSISQSHCHYYPACIDPYGRRGSMGSRGT